MNNFSENGGKQYLKYASLRQAAEGSKLNFYYAISEFIDNSISSFLDEKSKIVENNNDEKLFIEIWKTENDDKICILDNAFGMDKKTLNDAMELSNTEVVNKNSHYNRYGMGMKNGIFWIGEDGEIITKKINGTKIKGKFNAIKLIGNNDFIREEGDVRITFNEYNSENEDNESNLINDHGTLIIIKHPKSRRNLKNDNIKKLKDFLGARYSEYLKSNEVEIFIYENEQEKNHFGKNKEFKVEEKSFWNLINNSFKLSDDLTKEAFNRNYD